MENPFLLDIPDKDEYTIEDYMNMQQQLDNKNIDDLLNTYFPPKCPFYELIDFKYRCVKSLKQKLIDVSNSKLPTKNLYKIGDGGNGKNCIVCCTPFSHDLHDITDNTNDNSLSESRYVAAQQIIKSLKEVDFNGHFYLFNGGFPNPTGTEMKYAGVPYCFKIFMMLEAKKLGFENVIWIDSGCYCINNPQRLFDILDVQETVIKYMPHGHNYDAMCFTQTMDLLNSITGSDLHEAAYIETIVFGLNLKAPIINKIIEDYYYMVKLGLPFMSIFPEEIVLASLFNKKENKHLLKNNQDFVKLQIHESRMDMSTARQCGFFFLHIDYSKYKN